MPLMRRSSLVVVAFVGALVWACGSSSSSSFDTVLPNDPAEGGTSGTFNGDAGGGPTCTPKTCAAAGANCGPLGDGCGGVIASCGTKIGVVDHVEGNAIKLTRNDSPDGQRHYLPASMIERVDDQVHLNKNSEEARKAWKPDAASGGCG